MHSSSCELENNCGTDGEVLVSIATLVTEGRIPGKAETISKGFHQGPHCRSNKATHQHTCDSSEILCKRFATLKSEIIRLWTKKIPLCLEVLLNPGCSCLDGINSTKALLLEQWYFNYSNQKQKGSISFFTHQLINAVQSQLYFSQLSAWLSSADEFQLKLSSKNIIYNLGIPGEMYEVSKFIKAPITHNFPPTNLNCGSSLNITLLSLPRMTELPKFTCLKCEPKIEPLEIKNCNHNILDDRMHVHCMLKGKHCCEDFDDIENPSKKDNKYLKSNKRICNTNKLNKIENSSECPNQFVPGPSNLRNEQVGKLRTKMEIYRSANEKYNPSACNNDFINTEKRNLLNTDQHSKNETKSEHLQVLISQNNPMPTGIHKTDLMQHNNKEEVSRNVILRSSLEAHSQSDSQNSTNRIACCQKPVDLSIKIENEGRKPSIMASCDLKCVQKLEHLSLSLLKKCAKEKSSDCDFRICDNSCEYSDIFNIKNTENTKNYIDSNCDSYMPHELKTTKKRDASGTTRPKARQRIMFDEADRIECKTDENNTNSIDIPSPIDQAKFRKSFDNAASMVFHSRTGLPLTSSPAPVRKGKKCFDFDASINSVSAIKSALFSASISTDEESESDGSIVSPCSPESFILPNKEIIPVKYNRRGHAGNLLGTFEESVLNGRLEPVSTVQGFKAELGASGSFVPRHLICPVTVFFYTLGDNSSPYLGHINLGKKGYNVPKTGTVQVTLFNPLGTVVKMFVILYNLSDMPANSQTFIRQRTLYLPTNCVDKNIEWGPKWLRYLIHLRFMSSKSGRIYLHSDIRLIIFRKSDLDTATAHDIDMCYELRSFTHMPSNPKYSPRK